MKIYVASSWRNEYQFMVVRTLRILGHEVYDFKNPHPGDKGFSWSEVDKCWQNWSTDQFKEGLQHDIAKRGFQNDFAAMLWADCCVMVLPCGRSAHTEAGWMKGRGKHVYVFSPEKCEPELMYKVYDGILGDYAELVSQFQVTHGGMSGLAIDNTPHSTTFK